MAKNTANQYRVAGFYPLKDLPNGEFIKYSITGRVYQRGAYDRTSGKYEVSSVNDVNSSTYRKGDILVYAGFEY